MAQPAILDGVRVLDLTSIILGTYATELLGDLGADVVKIEQPGDQGGDIMRWGGPMPEGSAPGMGPLFMALNRNKRSVGLDLKQEAGREALLRLAAKADLFISNMRLAGLERLKLGYEGLKAARADIIYVHAAGFGSDGPYAGQAAYDETVQAAAGMADLYPRAYGEEQPRYLPTLAADKTVALYAVYASLAALYHRALTGEGQFVEVPMFECMTHYNMSENLYAHIFRPPTGEYGYGRILNPDRRPYRTKDGWIAIAPYSDRNWRDFFGFAGREADFANDERFNSYAARIANSAALYAMVEEITVTRTTEEWLALAQEKAIPASRVNRLDSIMDDPHLAATGFFSESTHPSQGPVVDMKHPVRFSNASAGPRRPAPRLGEHNDEVFADWGVEPPG
ncbi:MAG TPA: CoA transferase [Hyphomicrobiales bacterium]|nr:CoA transferase [Hyphomicrobiales bacterium]